MKGEMIVCKFGGSATISEDALVNIKALCKDKERAVLVYSALGRENENEKKLTDLLIELTKNKNNQKELINQIKQKFNIFLEKINVKININKKIDLILKEYNKNNDEKYLISRGEYLTSYLMSKFLKIKFIPAEKIMFFKNGKINYKKIKEKLKKYINRCKRILIPGFYGVDENKNIVLFSRGGSDVSGAIFARALAPCVYENWTNEAGIKEVNPSICQSQTIKRMNYNQLKIMTQADATVIHHDCSDILKGRKIVLQVGSILDLTQPKTIVSDRARKSFFVSFKEEKNKIKIISPLGQVWASKENYKEKIKQIYSERKKK